MYASSSRALSMDSGAALFCTSSSGQEYGAYRHFTPHQTRLGQFRNTAGTVGHTRQAQQGRQTHGSQQPCTKPLSQPSVRAASAQVIKKHALAACSYERQLAHRQEDLLAGCDQVKA